MMFVHSADAHLGIARYSKFDPETGQNLRGQDFLNSFNELCDYVVETRPDMFLFCGDLFDRVNPTNYMRRAVQERFFEISNKAIETIVISGNHETPKSKGVSNPLVLYRDIPHIHIVFNPTQFEFGDYGVNAVPFTPHPQNHIANPIKSKKSILMMHTTIKGAKVGSERYMCFDEGTMEKSEIPKYDYVALGHIHKAQDLSNESSHILYPGSLERYDYNEAYEKKGFYVFDEEPEFIEVTTRPMISRILDVTGLLGHDITEICLDILNKENIDDKIIRIELVGKMEEIERNSINYSKIKENALTSAHFAITDRTVSENNSIKRNEKLIFSPYVELERYLKMTNKCSDEVLIRGNEIIQGRLDI